MNTNLKIILSVSIILVAIVLSFYLASLFSKDDSKVVVSNKGDLLVTSLTNEISKLKAKEELYKDTIFGLRVEKGHGEVELNKSRSEVDRLIAQSKKYRIIKDTALIVSNCDSIINEVLTSYIPASEFVMEISNVIDSMQQVQIQALDSIDAVNIYVRSVLKNDLYNEKMDNAMLRQDIKKKRKVPVLAAIGGFVAGILIVIFIQ